MADHPNPAVQTPGVYHRKLGDGVITAVNDGMFEGATALMTNIEPADAEALLASTFRPLPPRLTVNTFLLTIGGKRILFDTGCAASFGPTVGKMLGNLAALGVAPDTVSTVLLTHAHPDHANGLIDAAGAAVFPNAELVVSAPEAAFWQDDAIMSAVPDEMKPYFVGARAALAAYADRTRLIAQGEVLPGITAIPAYGHTAGHTAYLVESGGDSLLIWGDVVHLPGVQFARPEVGVIFDADGPGAIATRARLMDMAVTDKLAVAGMHLDFPVFGHVIRQGQGYAHVPEVWTAWV
jgi:glyoxylase-like metal-dependent hydrolase (beta-lactamase superfamily II)